MGWSGGTYTQTDGTNSGTGICAAQAGDGDAVINASEMDALFEDHATAINQCLNKDGSNAATGDLDLGTSYHLTNVANGSASGDSGTWNKDVATLSLDGLTLECNFNDTTKTTVDLTSVSAGAGAVTTTGDQSVAGIKTFTGITELAHIKNNGPVTRAVANVTSSTTPTFDTTANSSHFISLAQNQTWTLTWPTAAADTQLGSYWVHDGYILARNTGTYTITLDATMLAALDDYSTEGAPAGTSGSISTLAYTYYYLNGTKYAHFAWVATTA